MSVRDLPIQMRGYPSQRSEHNSKSPVEIRTLLVDDTETSTETQRLLFGTGIVYNVSYPAESPVELRQTAAYLYYADDLPTVRPRTYLALKRYCRAHPGVTLMSHTIYMRNVYLVMAVTPDGAITGFNLSFDIWRHVSRVSPARGRFFYGGLSGEFLNGETGIRYHEIAAGIGMKREFAFRKGEQRVATCQVIDTSQMVRAITGGKHSLRSAGIAFGCDVRKFGGPEIHDPEHHYSGHDMMGYLSHYIDYNLNDVRATADLFAALMTQFRSHPIQLSASLAFSPASIGKQYTRDMGIHAALCVCKKCLKTKRGGHRISKRDQGLCMSSFYGGRAEVLTRMTDLPCVLCDFTSEYPTSMILLELWDLLTAERIEARDEPAEVQELLDGLTLDALFNPDIIRQLRGFAVLIPDDYLLPVRAPYGEVENAPPGIGINHLTADRELPYSLPDLAACKILTGVAPRITRAVRFYPAGGLQRTLKTINLYSDDKLSFNPRSANLFKFVVEERQAAKQRHKSNREVSGWDRNTDKCLCEACERGRFLKVFGNGIYGIFAEMNRKRHATPVTGFIYGYDNEPCEVKDPEESGEFCFPPFASVITATGRLLLAMLQQSVRELGSEIVFCDTDSACIPATPHGGTEHGINLLTYAQVDVIRERFNSLNPYNRKLVPELLKWEWPEPSDNGYEPIRVVGISAKRYCLYRQDGDDITILKRSEHGLGLYLNPLAASATPRNQDWIPLEDRDSDSDKKPDWISEVWEYIVRTEILRQDVPEPEWFSYPAMTVLPVRTRHVWETLKEFNADQGYYSQIVPFNFHLAVHASAGESREPLRLIAPFTNDSASWLKLTYVDIHTRKQYRITTDVDSEARFDDSRLILVKPYGEIIRRYICHPEDKYDSRSGGKCKPYTRGVLQPCHIIASGYELITKDATSLSSPDEGFAYTGHAIYTSDLSHNAYVMAREWFKVHGYTWLELVRATRLTEREARNFLSMAQSQPRNTALHTAISYASRRAAREISPSFESKTSVATLTRWHREYRAGSIAVSRTSVPGIGILDSDAVLS